MIRLCRALGFREPRESTGANNSNAQSLVHVLEVYQQQYDQLLKDNSIEDSKIAASEYMTSYEFNGAALGRPARPSGETWIYCGLEGDENELAAEFRRDYCGKCFHLECSGLVTKPKATAGRIQCIKFLADRRFRPRAPPSESLISRVSFHQNGDIRILGSSENVQTAIRTLLLVCKCNLAVGSGLPCVGMLAVAQNDGAVLDYRLFHSHWPSHHVSGRGQSCCRR